MTRTPCSPAVDRVSPAPALVRRGILCLCVAAGLPLLQAGPGTSSTTLSIAEREVARRNMAATEAAGFIQQGNEAMQRSDTAAAVAFYRQALDLISAAPAYATLRQQALSGFSEASVAHAEELAAAGRSADANQLLDAVLAPGINPEYRAALDLKLRIQDPDHFNPALSAAQIERVQEVRRLLTLGNGHFDIAEFDKARDTFNQVLALDPYNTAARRGLERVEAAISDHYLSARDHTRARALREVDELWAAPAAQVVDVAPETMMLQGGELPGRISVRRKLREIILPQIQLVDASLDEIVQFIAMQAKAYDTLDPDPASRGVNIVLGVDPGLGQRRLSLSLANVPLEYVLQTVARQAGTRLQVSDFVVTLGEGAAAQLVTRSYRVPAGFFTYSAAGPAAPADPFAAGQPETGGGLTLQRVSPTEFLTRHGLTFPDGANAFYSAATSTLTLRSTPENHELVQSLIEQASTDVVRQVKIKVIMLEVNQENNEEMTSDVLLGAFNVDPAARIFATGGTGTGDQAAFAQNFPLVAPGGTPVGQYPMTAGNRSGTEAVADNSIDSLLRQDQRGTQSALRAPAIFGVAGVFTDPQVQFALRALDQKKGVDIMATPMVVAKSGQRAKVQVLREFPYPTEFEPPEIPQDFGSSGSQVTLFQGGVPIFSGLIGGGASANQGFPVTPTTPTAFETQNVGYELEVEATVGPDNHTIELDVAPSFRAFEGMINYGTPIVVYPDGNTPVVLTENRIPQPVFRTNRTEGVKVSLYSGSTLAIAGMVGDERILVDDKTPIFGDLPVIGKYFRSHVVKSRTKSVVFLLRAEIMDAGGEGTMLRTSVAETLPPSELVPLQK